MDYREIQLESSNNDSVNVFKYDNVTINCSLNQTSEYVIWKKRDPSKKFRQMVDLQNTNINRTNLKIEKKFLKKNRIYLALNNSLIIQSIRYGDAGIYECFINDTKIKQLNVTVSRKPLDKPYYQSDEYDETDKDLLTYMSAVSGFFFIVNLCVYCKRNSFRSSAKRLKAGEEQACLTIKDLIIENMREIENKTLKGESFSNL